MLERKKTGIIGWPLNTTASPAIHRRWFHEFKIDSSYDTLPIQSKDLAKVVPSLKEGYLGFNVTIPHKEKIIPMLDKIDMAASRIKAVNTVLRHENGMLEGKNTDGYGFIQNLKYCFPNLDPWKDPVTVIGAGGASRAIVDSLITIGVPEIRLINRSIERSEKIARDFGQKIKVFAWNNPNRINKSVRLVINTTSLGTKGEQAANFDMQEIHKNAIVADIVYSPLRTPLLIKAQELGLSTLDGLGMLLFQAAQSFFVWHGVKPIINAAMKDRIIKDL